MSSRNTTEPTLLQGLLACEECSYAYYRTSTRTSKRKIYYYRCLGSDRYRWPEGRKCASRPLRQDYVDNLVWEHVVQLLEDPKLIREEIDRRLESGRRLSPARRRGDSVSKELQRVHRSSQKLVDAYQEDLLQLDELRPRIKELRKRQKALETEQRSLEAQQVDEESLLQITHSVDDFLQRLSNSAETLDILQRQQVVRLVVKEVLIGQHSIRIRHSIPIGRAGPAADVSIAPNYPSYLLCTGSQGRPLGRATVRRRKLLAVEHPRMHALPYEPGDRPIGNPLLKNRTKLSPANAIEERLHIRVQYPVRLTPHTCPIQCPQRIMGTTPWPETVGAVPKVLLVDRRQHLTQCPLDQLVLKARDADRPRLATLSFLGDVDSPQGLVTPPLV